LNKKQDLESKISLFNIIGLAILAFCYLGALYNIYKVQGSGFVEGKKVIRLAHWQLELGVRDAIEELAKDFEAQNPGVDIVQIPITERAYAQWVTTQLIGRTAPDLIELGMFNVIDYCGRYFMPLGDIIRKPNPYNSKDPNLKNLPWMDTFHDGLASTYITELLDYYGIGFSRFTIRIFYNKDIFKEVLGSDAPPKDLTHLFEICDKINKYAEDKNKEIESFNKEIQNSVTPIYKYIPFLSPPKKSKFILDPIASSRYQVSIFRPRYSSMLTAKRTLELDTDFDGYVSLQEFTISLIKGSITFDDEYNIAALRLMKDLSKYFNPGFMSIDRMDAGFAFVQGKAAMITSGSWDASSFIKKIKDQPAGDIILEVNGKKVNSAAEAENAIMLAAEKREKIELKIERDTVERKVSIAPEKGKNLWERVGIKIQDISDDEGSSKRPFVVNVEELSPAAKAGIKKRMRFNVGIFDFPLPKNHPIYGKYFVGNVKEVAGTGFGFGIVKYSKNADLAIKFLQFATTPQNNERLNSKAQWIPSVKGAKPIKTLEPFEPIEEGYWGWLSFSKTGGRTGMIETQLYWPYISGESSIDDYLKKMNSLMPQAYAVDYVNEITNNIEKTPDKNYLRSIWLAKLAFPENETSYRDACNKLPASWENYLRFKNSYPRHLVEMEQILKNQSNNNFSKEFFNIYNNLSIKK